MSLAYLMSLSLIVLGLYTIVRKRNLIKIIIGLSLVEVGVNLFFIALGYKRDSIAPIFTHAYSQSMTLPMPQAAVLTSIVIGLAVTSLMLAFAINYYKQYGTLDSTKGRLKG